jgi:hypothetical protein
VCFPDITVVLISTSLIPIHPGTWRSGSVTTFRAAESAVGLATVFCTAKIKKCQFSRTQSKCNFPQILPIAAVCATFTSFLTDEAAAQGSKARFKATSVFLLSYDDLLWRALLILHGLFGTEVSVLVPPGGRGAGLGVMRGCLEHLPEDPGCSIAVGHIAVADNLAGGSCHGPCQPPLPHTTIPPTRAIRAITRMSRRGKLNGSAPLWGILRPLIVIAKTKISHSPFRKSLWRLQLTLGLTLRQLCLCV